MINAVMDISLSWATNFVPVRPCMPAALIFVAKRVGRPVGVVLRPRGRKILKVVLMVVRPDIVLPDYRSFVARAFCIAGEDKMDNELW